MAATASGGQFWITYGSNCCSFGCAARLRADALDLLVAAGLFAAVLAPRALCPALTAAFVAEAALPARAAAFGDPAPDFRAWAPLFEGALFAAAGTRLAAHAFVAALPAVRSRRRSRT